MSKKNKAKKVTIPQQSKAQPNKIPFFKLIIAFIIAISFLVRLIPWPNVMTDKGVELKGADAYYFVRQAENIKNGGLPDLDPMFCAPNGLEPEKDSLLYSQILAAASKISSLENVTAWSGPIIGTMSIFVIFLILKELFPENDYAVVTGTFIAGLTGLQFIARSYFGFGDRHVLETLFSFLGLWATVKTLNKDSWKWALIAASSFILYTLSWSEAPTLIMFIGLGVIIECLVNNTIIKSWRYILVINIPQIIAALIIPNHDLLIYNLGLSLLTLIILALAIKFPTKKKQIYILTGLFVVAGIVIYVFVPALFNKILTTLNGFLFPDAVSSTISEYQPMFVIYQNFIGLTNKAGYQVLIHFLTAIGFIYMARKKNWLFVFLGITLLIISLAKIRAEYYLFMINAVSFGFMANQSKRFAYFGIIIAVIFATLYWGDELRLSKNSSLIFTNNDYAMAEWMKVNLPDPHIPVSGTYAGNPKPDYWILGRWDIGYLYGYIAKKPMLAAPNLCNYLVPSQLLMMSDEDSAYNFAKAKNVKYVVVRFNSLSRYYSEATKLNIQPPELLGGKADDGKIYYLINQAYYQSLNVRLFNFDGQTATPKTVFYFKNKKPVQTDNFEEALKFSDNQQYYSLNPEETSIQLDTLRHFKLIRTEGNGEDAVKLFEVVD